MKNVFISISVIVSTISFAMETPHTPLKRGILIAVEGIDGSGKSTLGHHLYDALKHTYVNISLTKEPGDTRVGQKIRKIVQTQTTSLDPKTEYLLFAADRAEHFSKIILPLLQENYIVISDRLADSSLAYQGYGRNLDKDMIQLINQYAMSNRKPDLTIFVKVPVQTALERIKKRNVALSTFEKESFLEKVDAGFNTIYANYCTSERFEKFSKYNQELYISQLEQNKTNIIYPTTTPLNLTKLDPAEFKTIPAQHVKVITVNGVESEQEVANKTIAVVSEWIARNNQ